LAELDHLCWILSGKRLDSCSIVGIVANRWSVRPSRCPVFSVLGDRLSLGLEKKGASTEISLSVGFLGQEAFLRRMLGVERPTGDLVWKWTGLLFLGHRDSGLVSSIWSGGRLSLRVRASVCFAQSVV